jgi:hypothetical protein
MQGATPDRGKVRAMDFGWLWQGLVSNGVWELVIFAAGIAVAILRKRDSKWVGPLLYGIVTVASLAVIWFTFTGRSLFSTAHSAEVTPENVEENLKTWADHLAMSLERQAPSDTKFFAYIGRAGGPRDPVEISRVKEKPGYLQLNATISLSPEHQAALSKLSKQDSTKFINELGLEMARLKMGASLGIAANIKREPIQLTVALQKAVPISNLNEGYFAERFDEMTGAMAQVRAITNLALATQQIPPQN